MRSSSFSLDSGDQGIAQFLQRGDQEDSLSKRDASPYRVLWWRCELTKSPLARKSIPTHVSATISAITLSFKAKLSDQRRPLRVVPGLPPNHQ